MQRDVTMTVKIPKELESDFRLFTVLHGGAIVSAKDESDAKNQEEQEDDYEN